MNVFIPHNSTMMAYIEYGSTSSMEMLVLTRSSMTHLMAGLPVNKTLLLRMPAPNRSWIPG
jgi:hypothetical protein